MFLQKGWTDFMIIDMTILDVNDGTTVVLDAVIA